MAPSSFDAEIGAFAPISLSEMDAVSLLNRVDTKYIILSDELPLLLQQIRASYRALFHLGSRSHSYRTLYFDTPDHAMYLRHHNGLATRFKVRKRWYLGADFAFIEVKRRTNCHRTIKKRMRLSSSFGQLEQLELEWLTPRCPYDVSTLSPQIWTHFERMTLVDLDLQERVTIDHHLRFGVAAADQPLANPDWRSTGHDFCVVEVKRGSSRNHSFMMRALRDRHTLPASFSKYCIGSAFLQPRLKHNRFMPILRAIGGLQR